MTKYLLDTNVVLRFTNPSDNQHNLVTEAVAILLEGSDECYLTADARIVAVMLSSGISHILTLNPNDFKGLSEIITVHPQTIVNSTNKK